MFCDAELDAVNAGPPTRTLQTARPPTCPECGARDATHVVIDAVDGSEDLVCKSCASGAEPVRTNTAQMRDPVQRLQASIGRLLHHRNGLTRAQICEALDISEDDQALADDEEAALQFYRLNEALWRAVRAGTLRHEGRRYYVGERHPHCPVKVSEAGYAALEQLAAHLGGISVNDALVWLVETCTPPPPRAARSRR